MEKLPHPLLGSSLAFQPSGVGDGSSITPSTHLGTVDAAVTNTSHKTNAKSIPIFLHLLALPISSQVTIGLAKIFNFEILTHGTSFKNNYGILKNGADPARGGSEGGSTLGYDKKLAENAKGYFYVFKDSQLEISTTTKGSGRTRQSNGEYVEKSNYSDKKGNLFDEEQFKSPNLLEKAQVHISPKIHATLAGTASSATENNVKKIAKIIFYGPTTFFFSPTLRFMYAPDEIKGRFENDPDYGGKAYRTSEALSNNRIGLVGVGKHANVKGLEKGVRERPLRVVAGVVQVVAGSIITLTGLGLVL